MAVDAGLQAVALTDHDTVSGIDEFLAAARGQPITAVPGVEVSAMISSREVHILGFFIDHQNSELRQFLDGIRVSRNLRNENMIRRIRSLGYDISMEEVTARAGGESIGRPHVAALLIEKGYFKDSQQAFERCLRRGAPGYCSRELPPPQEAIARIRAAGGVSVWAHPVYRNKYARSHVRGIIKRLQPLGLNGVEGYYPGYTPAQQQMLFELAEMHQLIISGGTDFHGSNMPTIAIGSGYGNFHVPVQCFHALQKCHEDVICANHNSITTGE